jgi:hypothetical protein
MNRLINANRVGLVLGGMAGGWQLLWSLMVAVGLAQPILDFVFWIHFVKPAYAVAPFDFAIAATLVVTTTIIGYIVGAAFGVLWNALHNSS